MFGRRPILVNQRVTKKFDLSIGRDGRWGNPIRLKDDSKEARDKCVDEHDIWIWNQIRAGKITLDELLSLEGKTLACWCVPKRCHGHNIVRAVQWARALTNKWERIKKKRRRRR